MATKEIQKHFGAVAIEKGYITLDQLVEARKTQIREEHTKQRFKRIGEIFLELGYIDETQAEEILNDPRVFDRNK